MAARSISEQLKSLLDSDPIVLWNQFEYLQEIKCTTANILAKAGTAKSVNHLERYDETSSIAPEEEVEGPSSCDNVSQTNAVSSLPIQSRKRGNGDTPNTVVTRKRRRDGDAGRESSEKEHGVAGELVAVVRGSEQDLMDLLGCSTEQVIGSHEHGRDGSFDIRESDFQGRRAGMRSSPVKTRSLLAAASMAREYDDWERRQYPREKTGLDRLRTTGEPRPKARGRIPEFKSWLANSYIPSATVDVNEMIQTGQKVDILTDSCRNGLLPCLSILKYTAVSRLPFGALRTTKENLLRVERSQSSIASMVAWSRAMADAYEGRRRSFTRLECTAASATRPLHNETTHRDLGAFPTGAWTRIETTTAPCGLTSNMQSLDRDGEPTHPFASSGPIRPGAPDSSSWDGQSREWDEWGGADTDAMFQSYLDAMMRNNI